MATRYKEVIKALYQDHADELSAFQEIHDNYKTDQKKWQQEFNDKGSEIMDLFYFAERQLCGKSERSGMGVYSSNLAEKFWMEIKKKLPLIDFVGVKIV